ncbi:MAG: LacI family DNA-binding transcriptional regulator [Mobiluncus porci]|uniref:LacI family DNA-binding transcriptional regulator n=1 Tax=Mobiluncus porci TaxID=2652278 RepID=UPI0023F1E4EF|nr:LacI family DNA-binding transcriptional regulator [Mobiluncus porci]MDD7541086.1 LacI family DNA-binding transcriptional regulator [Mobiluncus porci]MDY5747545.1 LacI family DNA-binding transcriptional regulator [Mobiluncus porci]
MKRKQRATIKDVACAAGVGIVTVSRALNGKVGVSEATRERIQQIATELDYEPNRHAQFLKLTASRSIAVFVKGLDNQLFSPILNILEHEIRERDYLLNVVAVPHWADEFAQAVKIVEEDSISGVVFLGGRFQHNASYFDKLKVPLVLSTMSGANQALKDRYSSVAVDDYGESRRIVEYLLSLGHRRIAIIGSGMEDFSVGRLRLEGYLDAMENAGITPLPSWQRSFDARADTPYNFSTGYHITLDLLKEAPEVTAIFSVADVMAIGALRAASEMGRRVPEDLSIFGFDGIPVGRYLVPKLSTLEQPVEEIARITCELLFDSIEGKAPRHVTVPGIPHCDATVGPVAEVL